MTYDDLLGFFLDLGARQIDERASGSLIEFMVYPLFIPRPMNGDTYDEDELNHHAASFWQQTDGEIGIEFEDHRTKIMTWESKMKESK